MELALRSWITNVWSSLVWSGQAEDSSIVSDNGGSEDSSSSGVSFLGTEVILGIIVGFVIVLFLHIRNSRSQVLVEPPFVNKFDPPRGFIEEELAEYNGIKKKEILLGCKGTIFQVSSGWYGPEGPYHAFAGKEASRQLGKIKVNTIECNADWRGLSHLHLQQLDEWYDKFEAKYIKAGWFVPPSDYEKRAEAFEQ